MLLSELANHPLTDAGPGLPSSLSCVSSAASHLRETCSSRLDISAQGLDVDHQAGYLLAVRALDGILAGDQLALKWAQQASVALPLDLECQCVEFLSIVTVCATRITPKNTDIYAISVRGAQLAERCKARYSAVIAPCQHLLAVNHKEDS